MKIKKYINQLPENTQCEKDPTLLKQHAPLGALFREERNPEYEEAPPVPAQLIDPLF